MRPTVRSLRHLLLVLFFVGLAALEITHGVSRIDALRTSLRDELLGGVERRHAGLAAQLSPLLENKREHASYFARLGDTRRLLESGPANPRAQEEFRARFLPYLVTFRSLDRIRLLDGEGIEQFRCQRNANSVASLGREQLVPDPDTEMLALALAAGEGSVGVSTPALDQKRVEAPERDRQVLHYAALVTGDRGHLHGVLVLTVYASPLLNHVRRYTPIEAPCAGGSAFLVDGAGNYLAHPSRELELGGGAPSSLSRDHPRAAAGLLAGETRVATGDTIYLALPVADTPSWRLVSAVPERLLDECTTRLIGREYAWITASMVAATLIIGVAMAFFMRLSARELRLKEGQRYLAQITRESEKYRALLEGGADMILVVDAAGDRVRESNARAREAFPALRGGAQGPVRLGDLFAPVSVAALGAGIRDALAKPGEPLALGELAVRSLSDAELPVDARAAAVDLGDERVVQISLRDLSRQKEMERQLRIAERLSSLGQLTAGVAHEINNPLEGIGNYLSLLERNATATEPRQRYLAQVRHGFERIRDLVRDLSAFARPEKGGDRADISAVVEQALSLVQHSKEFREIEVRRSGLDAPVTVQGDPGRLEQVVINLLINAAQAMQGKGGIDIQARRVAAAPGEEVEIIVSDEGPGIPEGVIDRIFDPFFSTKHTSGLGLSISYGIIRVHGGTLSAANRPEGGACFTIRLPARAAVDERRRVTHP